MLKSKAILRKCFRILFSEKTDLQLFEEHVSSFNSKNLECPFCHRRGQFSPASSYRRSLVTIENGMRKDYFIEMPRVRCSCGRCHAVVPDFLVPYGSYTIRFILYVLRQYLHLTSRVSAFCSNWQISVSTLYKWIHLFKEQFNFWVGSMLSIRRINLTALDQVEDIEEFPDRFLWKTASFSFLQQYPSLSDPPMKT